MDVLTTKLTVMITTLALTIVVILLRDVFMKSMFVRTKVLAIL